MSKRIVIQSLEHVIPYVEQAAKDLNITSNLKNLYLYMINRALAESGNYNVIYSHSDEYEMLGNLIAKHLINSSLHRHAQKSILEGIILPPTIDDQSVVLECKGNLLLAYFN